MKKILITIFCVMLSLGVLSGCADNTGSNALSGVTDNNDIADVKKDSNIVEIKEKMFITQINDIYQNPNDYKGKVIKLEGMYDYYQDEETGKEYHGIIRNGPGCCGNDGVAGFHFTYNGDKPKQNDWIAVEGTVVSEGENNVTLALSKLTVKTKRGAEYVSN